MIHRLADCMNKNVPESTNVWQFCVIFPDCEIGENCNICAGALIENDVKVGNNVTVKSGIQLWDGVTIEDNVFLGPNVTFTNNLFPRSKQYPKKNARTLVKKGASIGANCTILAGRTIGENAMVGAGSVVTKDIPANEVWAGNPAKIIRLITEDTHNKIVKTISGGEFSIESLEAREELRSKGRVCGERRAA